MGVRNKAKGRLRAGADKERDRESIRLINQLLGSSPVDLAQLRKVAAVRGLVNNQLRARAWPVLLGCQPLSDSDLTAYQRQSTATHRDTSVVDCDVARSLWTFTAGWSADAREAQRGALRRLLTAVVAVPGGGVHYYQGLHDIASVLLLVAGETGAYAILACLTRTHLRDCTQPSLDAVLEVLGLLGPLLEAVDPHLAAHLTAAELPPFFALSWYITWFAHNVVDLGHAARLFDLFLASHPLMPLYVAVAVMQAARDEILACEADPAELHRLLTHLPPLGHLAPDGLACAALAAFRAHPPAALLAGRHLARAVAVEAYIQDGHWSVPRRRLSMSGGLPGQVLGLASLAARLARGGKARARATAIATLALTTLSCVAILVLQSEVMRSSQQ